MSKTEIVNIGLRDFYNNLTKLYIFILSDIEWKNEIMKYILRQGECNLNDGNKLKNAN